MPDYLGTLAKAVQTGDAKLVEQTLDEALGAGITPKDILDKGLITGLQAVGQLFKDGQAYLPEMLVSARAMKAGVNRLSPLFAAKDVPKKGTVVLGTVSGDLHDIGKNLVRMMLECNGYEVHDLGRDVPAGAFVSAARDIKPDILGMSALLSTTMTYIPEVVRSLQEAGLKGKVKLMIGGAPITRKFADELGVEGYADDCASAVDEVDRLMRLAT